MNKLILAAALAAGCTIVSSAPALGAAAKNYDCSKAGNANKAACKGKTTPAPAKAAPAKPAAAPKVAAATTKTTTTARNYDCSKAGNANKAQCKGKTTVAATTTTAPAKPGMLQRMKNAMSGGAKPTPAPTPAAAPATKPAPAAHKAPAAASNEDKNPAGAIAQCKDGTYSHAKQRTGACSRHGGVAKWS